MGGSDPKPEEVSRVIEDDKPKYQLNSGEEGLSVFAGMSDSEVMAARDWREGSKVEKKKVADLEAEGMVVVQTHGNCEDLNEQAQDNHWEIQKGDMTRNEFKKKMKDL